MASSVADPGTAELDPDAALRAVDLVEAGMRVVRSPEGHLIVSRCTPQQMALFMDALFRGQMGIRPHEGEDDDYAIGAEW